MSRTRLATVIAVAALLVGLAGVVGPRPASAIPIPPSTSTCSYNGNPGVVTANNSTATTVTVTCPGLPGEHELSGRPGERAGRRSEPVLGQAPVVRPGIAGHHAHGYLPATAARSSP